MFLLAKNDWKIKNTEHFHLLERSTTKLGINIKVITKSVEGLIIFSHNLFHTFGIDIAEGLDQYSGFSFKDYLLDDKCCVEYFFEKEVSQRTYTRVELNKSLKWFMVLKGESEFKNLKTYQILFEKLKIKDHDLFIEGTNTFSYTGVIPGVTKGEVNLIAVSIFSALPQAPKNNLIKEDVLTLVVECFNKEEALRMRRWVLNLFNYTECDFMTRRGDNTSFTFTGKLSFFPRVA